jgi:TRAP-type mannitol/chloroaromatic compound transport system permease small subunit
VNPSKLLTYIDRISNWTGNAISWLMLALVLEIVYDTIARYAFGAPTIWSFDISYMLYGSMFMLGGAYTLFKGEHIRVDLLYSNISERSKAIIDILGYCVFFFPPVCGLFVYGILFTVDSWKLMEHSNISYWRPPIYHYKSIIPVSAFLILMQGIVQFIRSISVVIAKRKEA